MATPIGGIMVMYSSASGLTTTASGLRTGAGVATTAPATVVTATGGTGAGTYTYAWNRTVGTQFTISNAASDTVTWSFSFSPTNTINETWVCTITDAHGHVLSVTCNVDLSWE